MSKGYEIYKKIIEAVESVFDKAIQNIDELISQKKDSDEYFF
jgi:hypothetical protein